MNADNLLSFDNFEYVLLSLNVKRKAGKLGLCHLLKEKKKMQICLVLSWVGPIK